MTNMRDLQVAYKDRLKDKLGINNNNSKLPLQVAVEV